MRILIVASIKIGIKEVKVFIIVGIKKLVSFLSLLNLTKLC